MLYQTVDWNSLGKEIILGIDEHSFRGRYLCITITDIKSKKLLAILTNDNQAELEAFLRSIPISAQIRIVEACMDQKYSYRTCVEKCLPKASIVADRFHIERLAKWTLDEMRKIILLGSNRHDHIREILLTPREYLSEKERVKLEKIFLEYAKFPVLRELWIIKNEVRKIYQRKNKGEARKQFNHCNMLMETSHHCSYITSLKKSLNRWKEQILNYYDRRTTNGFTEGCHTKIKMMKRISYGMRNVNTYIAKMMLGFCLPLLMNYLHTY